MNNITIVGRLAADIEVKYLPSGEALGNFTVASDVGFGDKKTTNWFRCTLFGKRVDAISQFLSKGQQVTVFGQLTLREWLDKNGVKQLSPDIRVNDIALQGGKQSDAAPAQRQQGKPVAPQQGGSFDDSDIPFSPLPRRALTTI